VEKKSSPVSWMILFVLIGIFVTFLIYLDKMPSSTSGIESRGISLDKRSGEMPNPPPQAVKKPPEHRFDFYTVLPDREVDVSSYDRNSYDKASSLNQPAHRKQSVPSVETHTQAHTKVPESPVKMPVATAKQPAAKIKSSSQALYQLQVGAFRDLAKADATKARLAFMGVESNIYVIRGADGQKIYRVRVGPNSDEQKLSRIQQQLKARNINAFMQKLKG